MNKSLIFLLESLNLIYIFFLLYALARTAWFKTATRVADKADVSSNGGFLVL